MNRITFLSIFLLWLINALHCKKYLVEVPDNQVGVTKTSRETPQPPEETNDDVHAEILSLYEMNSQFKV